MTRPRRAPRCAPRSSMSNVPSLVKAAGAVGTGPEARPPIPPARDYSLTILTLSENTQLSDPSAVGERPSVSRLLRAHPCGRPPWATQAAHKATVTGTTNTPIVAIAKTLKQASSPVTVQARTPAPGRPALRHSTHPVTTAVANGAPAT